MLFTQRLFLTWRIRMPITQITCQVKWFAWFAWFAQFANYPDPKKIKQENENHTERWGWNQKISVQGNLKQACPITFLLVCYPKEIPLPMYDTQFAITYSVEVLQDEVCHVIRGKMEQFEHNSSSYPRQHHLQPTGLKTFPVTRFRTNNLLLSSYPVIGG